MHPTGGTTVIFHPFIFAFPTMLLMLQSHRKRTGKKAGELKPSHCSLCSRPLGRERSDTYNTKR